VGRQKQRRARGPVQAPATSPKHENDTGPGVVQAP